MVVVAIPACNEADRIGKCLSALDRQIGVRADHIVLLINNTVDDTASVARAVRLHPRTRLHVLDHVLPPDLAHAGEARRLAMGEAARLAGPDGVIVTTDADGEVAPDWLRNTLAALRSGADVVLGWVALHPEEWLLIPRRLHEDDARESAYDALCDEIHARLDPDPADPLPRHTQHSGASIALTARSYAACGGVPNVAAAEDRALVAALRRVDARIRHAPEVRVSVSGRIEGRAPGGMADTIRRRMAQPDEWLDDRLEPAADCARRAGARAALRRVFDDPAGGVHVLSEFPGLTMTQLQSLLDQPRFGLAWDTMERQSAVLRRRRVAVADLPIEMAAAKAILAGLRARDDRAEKSLLVSAELA